MLSRFIPTVTLLLAAITLALVAWYSADQSDIRAQTILRECRDQNHRHQATIRQLDAEIAPYGLRIDGGQRILLIPASHHLTAAQRQQLSTSIKDTVLVIDALAPYQNCQHVLAQSR